MTTTWMGHVSSQLTFHFSPCVFCAFAPELCHPVGVGMQSCSWRATPPTHLSCRTHPHTRARDKDLCPQPSPLPPHVQHTHTHTKSIYTIQCALNMLTWREADCRLAPSSRVRQGGGGGGWTTWELKGGAGMESGKWERTGVKERE